MDSIRETAFSPQSPPRPLKSGTNAEQIPRSAVQNLIGELRADPFNVELHLKLAEVYVGESRFEDAVAVMKKAVALPTADVKTQEWLEDVSILRARHRYSLAQRESQSDSGAELLDLTEKLRVDLNRMELDVYRRRSERYPENLELRFAVATRLRLGAKMDEAAAALKPLLSEPRFQSEAHLEMGLCKQHQREFVVALSHFRRAAATACQPAQQDLKKRALYRAGSLAASMKLTESARTYFQQVVELAPDYKDAVDQLRKLTSRPVTSG